MESGNTAVLLSHFKDRFEAMTSLGLLQAKSRHPCRTHMSPSQAAGSSGSYSRKKFPFGCSYFYDMKANCFPVSKNAKRERVI